MLLKWTILPTVIIFHCVQAYHDDYEAYSCNQKEEFDLADMHDIIKISGKATCSQYQKIFRYNPDPNAKKGRVLSIPEFSGRRFTNIAITEFTTHPNGTIDRQILRTGLVMGYTKRFAPTTGILLNFTRNGGSVYEDYTFSGTLAETAQNHHCPFPFVDLQPYQPVILPETVVLYFCDVLLIAPHDYEIRIDHITDTSAFHETVIKIIDEDSSLIERFSSFPVEETMTGSGRVAIDVVHKSAQSHQIEIQVSAVKLNCSCGPSELVFNASLTSVFFQTPDYPKKHCKKVPCQTTLTIPVELRKEYKMQLNRFGLLSYSVIEITDGPNGIRSRHDRMFRPLTLESPIVTLKYTPEAKNGDVFSLELALVERQKGCECPHQPNIATNFYVEIPAQCTALDCVYLLPEFDDSSARYEMQQTLVDHISARLESSADDRFIFSNSGSGTWDTPLKGKHLIRFHRSESSRQPTVFNMTYTTSGVHISHADRCGCVNKTILLESGESSEFASPDWPAHYCDNLVCVTSYVAPAHHHLEVKLNTISLEPDNDSITLFEGANITQNNIKRITGEQLTSDPITSSSTIMTAVFSSNGAVSFDGFNGTITAVIDKSWADHLKNHISSWWWIIAIFICSIVVTALFILKRQGLRRSRSIHLMDL